MFGLKARLKVGTRHLVQLAEVDVGRAPGAPLVVDLEEPGSDLRRAQVLGNGSALGLPVFDNSNSNTRQSL